MNKGRIPSVVTFDIFDTLIARRCYRPHAVFEIMEQRLGIENFAQARIAAEARLHGGQYTFDDIYNEFARQNNIDAESLRVLKEMELAVEMEQAIPIRENMARVRDGDILVSDMYLPPDFIAELVRRAGLSRHFGLIVSAQGKKDGTIWPDLLSRYQIRMHFGDNAHSDVITPRESYGIPTFEVSQHKLSSVETYLYNAGMEPLACYARELRLDCHRDDTMTRELLTLQSQFNLPILILVCFLLQQTAQTVQADNILFLTRDSQLLHSVFQKLKLTDAPASMMFASRAAFNNAKNDPAYQNYLKRKITDKTLFVDVTGSGKSLTGALDALGMTCAGLFIINANAASFDRRYPIISVLQDPDGLNNLHLECLNYSDHSRFLGGNEAHGTWLPHFAENRLSAELKRLISAQQEFMVSALAAMDMHDFRSLGKLGGNALAQAISALAETLRQQHIINLAFYNEHKIEDAF